MTLGERHKNYLNVKNLPENPWMDAGGKSSKTDKRGHAIFTNAAWGLRAGILQLRRYYLDHHLQTIALILSRWAPSDDTIGSLAGAPPNSPKEYVLAVSKHLSIDPNVRLEIFELDRSLGHLGQLRLLIQAMAAYECAGLKVPDSEFNAAIELIEPGIKKSGTESS